MGKTIVVKEHETPIYEIRIENSYAHFDEVLRQLKIAGHRVCIVSDTTISKYYMKDVVEIVKDYASLVETFTLQPGEEHKNLDSVQALMRVWVTLVCAFSQTLSYVFNSSEFI